MILYLEGSIQEGGYLDITTTTPYRWIPTDWTRTGKSISKRLTLNKPKL